MDATTSSGDERGLDDMALTAAMGMVAGAIGVWALDRADYFMWNREDPETRARTRAVRPHGEPPAGVLVSEVEEASGRQLGEAQHEAAQQAVHYAIGIGPAAAYALVRDKAPVSGPARGLLYGLGVFLMQDEGINAVTRLGANPRDYPWQAHGRGLVAHLVYGLTTELALTAMERMLGRGGKDRSDSASEGEVSIRKRSADHRSFEEEPYDSTEVILKPAH